LAVGGYSQGSSIAAVTPAGLSLPGLNLPRIRESDG
jgi:hypothetical protein